MGVLDLVIIAVFVLFALWGVYRGFTRLIFKMIIIVATLLVALFLSRPVADGLMKTGIGASMDKLAEKAVSGLNIDDATVVKSSDGKYYLDINGPSVEGGLTDISTAFEQLKIPSYLEGEVTAKLAEGVSFKAVVVRVLATWIMTAIAALALGLVTAILLTVIKIVLVKHMSSKGIKAFDRVGGGLLNGVYCFLLITLIFAALNLLSGLSFMSGVNAYIAKNTVADWFFANNWFSKLLGWVSSLFVKA